jgi:hypothetical protein
MDDYCEKEGIIDLIHWTNGVRVYFKENMQSIWYEPGSLKIL